ncbi:MAG TPA: radical SAM protein [Vicinamibacterales bacterium]|nr:radical SAM protein [Vicinamibacterales bacterium]
MLIFPPDKHAVRAMYTFQDNDDTGIGVKPPLGPMFVAAYVKNKTDHEVKILDCQVLRLNEEQIKAEIRDFKPDVVGVCAWTDFWYDAWRCIQLAKEVDPKIHVTVGGPHVGIYSGVTLEHSGADSVIVGDGEIPFFWLVNAVSNGYAPKDLPGLHFKEHGVAMGEQEFYIHGDLDTLPHPDRTMLPYKSYHSVVAKSDYVTTMITSRGCPYKCTFCKLSFQKVLSRSAADVVKELKAIAALGIKEVEVYDDTFTWSKKRLIEICKGIVDEGLELDWAIRDRVSSPTPETMEWLARAGCRRIHFGIESGSNKTLKTIKKSIDTDQAIAAVALAKKHGIQVLTYFMLGLPGETVEDMRETIRFAKRLDPDYSTFSVTVPYAGTEMYQDGLAQGIIPTDYWLEFAKKPTPNFVVPYFWEEHLNKRQLLDIRDEATRSFYFRPKYVLKQLRQSASIGEVRRKGAMALGLFQATVLGKGRGEELVANSDGFANNMANPRSVRQ